MCEQAQATGYEVTYISAVEAGGQRPTDEYVESFRNWLGLGEREVTELNKRISAVVTFPGVKHVTKNSASIRLFRKISKMQPDEIRKMAKRRASEANDDG
jgi:hypothetical protein